MLYSIRCLIFLILFSFTVLHTCTVCYAQEPPTTSDKVPTPDPTRLTTQALREAIAGVKDIIYGRLDGIEKAIALQFEGIALQFKERDIRVEQTAQLVKTAVEAALQAAKEGVEKQNYASSQAAQKSELAFTKQIDQLTELFRTGTKSLEDKITSVNKFSDEKIAAINERITRIESAALGGRTASKDSSDSTMMIVTIIAGLVGVGGLVIAFVNSGKSKV